MNTEQTREPKSSGNVLAKSMGFSLGLALLFTLVANLLPQVKGEAPVEQEVDLGALTIESFVALGESIFTGKGTCSLCHNDLGRAPDILALNMVEVAIQHLKDERYKGNAVDAESYLHESLVDPGIYVVKDFGKKGSNDTISPMPAVNKAPIELSEIEINAVIAYLQAKDGNDVTVPLPIEAPEVEIQSAEPIVAGTIEEVLAKYNCQACHKVLGSGGDLGPDLEQVGMHLSPEQIRQSIIDPDVEITKGFPPGVMPQNFAEQMRVKELDMLVTFLVDGEMASSEKTARTPSPGTGVGNSEAEKVIAQFGCQACHIISGSGGELGPSLENVGAHLDADQIRQSIIEPNVVLTEGFPSGVMPPNFAEQMSDAQLDALVIFLVEQKGG
ncbi:MAG: c-type cytochrome [Gammaproteobacteria bacterium]|nr:c-type cytochrome [Gammaproteobacteria bacterium]MCF6261382.1 c-type cytochrome [Gammaproteobacteria bacterium]